MLTYKELAAEIERRPLEERLSLLEVITRTLRKDLPSQAERSAAMNRLRGIGRVEGKPAPTDEEIKEDYTNYLIEKYQ